MDGCGVTVVLVQCKDRCKNDGPSLKYAHIILSAIPKVVGHLSATCQIHVTACTARSEPLQSPLVHPILPKGRARLVLLSKRANWHLPNEQCVGIFTRFAVERRDVSGASHLWRPSFTLLPCPQSIDPLANGWLQSRRDSLRYSKAHTCVRPLLDVLDEVDRVAVSGRRKGPKHLNDAGALS